MEECKAGWRCGGRIQERKAAGWRRAVVGEECSRHRRIDQLYDYSNPFPVRKGRRSRVEHSSHEIPGRFADEKPQESQWCASE